MTHTHSALFCLQSQTLVSKHYWGIVLSVIDLVTLSINILFIMLYNNIVNTWVVQALIADWMTAVVYQTVYHGYDKTFIFTALSTLVTSL